MQNRTCWLFPPHEKLNISGESFWDEQAAGARCSEQPANSTKKTLQIFETLPLNWLEAQQKKMKQEKITCSYTK